MFVYFVCTYCWFEDNWELALDNWELGNCEELSPNSFIKELGISELLCLNSLFCQMYDHGIG